MEIKELYPVSEELAALKAEKDQELIDYRCLRQIYGHYRSLLRRQRRSCL